MNTYQAWAPRDAPGSTYRWLYARAYQDRPAPRVATAPPRIPQPRQARRKPPPAKAIGTQRAAAKSRSQITRATWASLCRHAGDRVGSACHRLDYESVTHQVAAINIFI